MEYDEKRQIHYKNVMISERLDISSCLYRLSQSPGFTLRLQECQDISVTDRTLHVSDNLTTGFTDELHFYLSTLTLGSSTAQYFNDASKNIGFIHFVLDIKRDMRIIHVQRRKR
ncbi:unnamed protein product [Euphydryas editha]|uniref:Uncharacterized protein n=1 Tax=Euphydryas editha TaxID=104508 RepID=A0AAU9TVJ0_EUPED|nr:unnamed protein product [Euphydryas editha]